MICADGSGFSEAPLTGRGLLGMRERAELLGGTLEVGPTAGDSTLITARIPLSEQNRTPENSGSKQHNPRGTL